MRHILILSLSFLFFSNSYAYRSIFGQTSTEWIITYGSMLMTGETDTFFISKDTMVYGVLYKKVSSNNSFSYEGLLREDTVSGKVWYRTMSPNAIAGLDTVEMLTFDFSLQKDDTFNMRNINYGTYFTFDDSLKKVDTVYYVNGLRYIQFKSLYPLGGTYEPPIMIEGIGSNWGVLWKEFNAFMNSDHYLVCSYKDGVQTSYVNVRYNGSCQSPTAIKENTNAANRIEVYPQPANDFIYIKDAGDAIASLKMRNVQGRVYRKFTEDIPKRIDVSDLPAGYYIAIIILEDGQKLTRKIIINH